MMEGCIIFEYSPSAGGSISETQKNSVRCGRVLGWPQLIDFLGNSTGGRPISQRSRINSENQLLFTICIQISFDRLVERFIGDLTGLVREGRPVLVNGAADAIVHSTFQPFERY